MEQKHLALRRLLDTIEKELHHKPSRKTLDRLSLLAGFQSWDDFLLTLKGEEDGPGSNPA